MRKLLRGTDMYIILIVAMVSHVHMSELIKQYTLNVSGLMFVS